ncbi:MAG: cytochrome C [Verrucomicrobia bacterium]|nr:cytochrome C [Verrucomicrobiota bacterium]
MKKILLLSLAIAGLLALPRISDATIVGSKHDFSTNSWNLRQSVCGVCHSAHHTDPDQLIPLWNHANTTQTYTLYDSPTFDGSTTITQPGGASKACLSCHDGTIAVNQSASGWVTGSISGGVTNAQYVIASRQIGNDGSLHTTHPISFEYDAVAAADNLIYPSSTTLTYGVGNLAGKTINDLLIGGKMECSSCHDVHKQKGHAPNDIFMRVISNTQSHLCLSCHNK